MTAQLTPQERMFLDRMATYVTAEDEITASTIEKLGKLVLADDHRLMGKLFRDDAFCAEAKKHLSSEVFAHLKGGTI